MADRLAFADIVVDPGHRRLLRNGGGVVIGERAFDLLLVLLEHPGEVVEKQNLLDEVWPDVVVGEESLAKAVSELRAALGDRASSPRFVQTVHRRGYRFIAEVRELASVSADARSRSRRWVVAAAAGVPAVVAILIAAFWPRPESPPFGLGPFEQVTHLPQSTFKPAAARGSDLLAAVVADPDTHEHALWLIAPGGESPLRLTRGIEVRGPSPVFSADDSKILFTAYRHDGSLGLFPALHEVPVLGGEVRMVLDGVSAASPSPAGSELACARVNENGTSIVVRSPAGEERTIAETGFWPRWSPDGRWIAYTTSDPEGGDGHLFVVRPDGRDRRRLTEAPTQHYGIAWTPDARWIIFAGERASDGDLFAVSPRGGTVHRITSGPGFCTLPVVTADGERLVFAYTTVVSTLYRADDLDSVPHRLLGGEPIHDLALSPDGRRLAVTLGEPKTGRRIALLELPDGGPRTLSGLDADHVRWAADGESLFATAASPDLSSRWIWRIPVNGGLPTTIVGGDDHWQRCTPSPDGARIAATRRNGDLVELVVIDLESQEQQLVARAPMITDPVWSPDGRHIAYSGGYRPADASSSGVWVAPVDGGAPRRLCPDGADPAWLGDGLLFARSTDLAGLWRVGLDGRPAVRVPRPTEDEWGFEIHGLEIGPGGAPLVLHLVTGSTTLYAISRKP